MRLLLTLLFLPLALYAFETIPVVSFPIVGYREIKFKDAHYHNHEREILVWYPVDLTTEGTASDSPYDVFHVAKEAPFAKSDQKKPLVVLSHGHCGHPHELSWLVRSLVHNGYIVLAIQHYDLIANRPHLNHWLRAQDITTVLDVFSADNLASEADLKRIGMAGFSIGGTTGLLLAGATATQLEQLVPSTEYASFGKQMRLDLMLPSFQPDMMAKNWRDQRIQSIFLMAPAWSWIFDAKHLAQISIPAYIVGGEKDKLINAQHNALFFAKQIPHSFYEVIPGAVNHYSFISALNPEQRKLADPNNESRYLFEDNHTIDRVWLQDQLGDEATRFFNWSLSMNQAG